MITLKEAIAAVVFTMAVGIGIGTLVGQAVWETSSTSRPGPAVRPVVSTQSTVPTWATINGMPVNPLNPAGGRGAQ